MLYGTLVVLGTFGNLCKILNIFRRLILGFREILFRILGELFFDGFKFYRHTAGRLSLPNFC